MRACAGDPGPGRPASSDQVNLKSGVPLEGPWRIHWQPGAATGSGSRPWPSFYAAARAVLLNATKSFTFLMQISRLNLDSLSIFFGFRKEQRWGDC